MISARYLICLILTALVVLGCAGQNAIREAESLLAFGRYEQGLAKLQSLAPEDTRTPELREALIRSRAMISDRMDREARLALDTERLDDAEQIYKRLLAMDPTNSLAKTGMLRLKGLRDRADQVAKAEELFRKGDLEGAERNLRGVLFEAPKHRKATALMAQISERQRKTPQVSTGLEPEFRKIISLEFRELNLRAVFDAIWHASGVNFILDRDVRSDAKVSIYVRDVTVEEAIDSVLIGQQLARKTVGSRTLFVYPKTPQKLSEYQDLVVRNYFLAHADPKRMLTMLKTILRIKDVFIDEKRNLVVIRDSQEAVDLADKLIRVQDQPDPEVMLALDVIEVKRSKLSDIGLSLPDQLTVGVGNPITVQALRDLTSVGVNIGFGGIGSGAAGVIGQLNLQRTDGDANTLANPRIRVRNREKAKIHIGDRLPVVTTTTSAVSTFIGQTVNYLDVGLMLEVEPQVMLDDDVIVKLNLEVSSATQSRVNPGFYDIGTRKTSTVLTIRDGETQILAGLIRDDELNSNVRFPGFGDIPVLGRLFSSERREQNKTEIILAITPQIIRNLTRPGTGLAEYPAGTETGRSGGASGTDAAPPRPAAVRPPQRSGVILAPQQPGTLSSSPQQGVAPLSPQLGSPSTESPGSGLSPIVPFFSPAPVVTPAQAAPAATAAPAQAGGSVPSAAPIAAPGQVAPAATAAPSQPGGVIPMIDFERPPGAGSPPGTR